MGKIMKMLELPGETVFRETQVILTGKRQALIENYRSILSCTREQIVVLTASAGWLSLEKGWRSSITRNLKCVSAGGSRV